MADQGSEGIFSPYLRSKRFEAAVPHLKGRVLDVGCGSGGLAEMIPSSQYWGVDSDKESIDLAHKKFPDHIFKYELPTIDEKFDTIVALAIIEHLSNPAGFLSDLACRLKSKDSRIICTTPHPSMEWIHLVGARLGLFSQHANEEHEELLDFKRLSDLGVSSNLRIQLYKKFLFGANQLIIFSQAHS
ncbi:class I SAM-dependent methyltransferase [Oscillatoria amoena NRMC-F 0135]|nr:class I SAM-dependent methyltransferase [Oscillatoria laete-virens]MDL5047210.1 class I SAM-dependent methyltransferase [Oscillatoria amoena NRMC-F 0135]MDL5055458.1 class I SAM-dependent methyltransferase [Oscillatoria laete-virens NRMC-F 0139]